MTRSKLIADLLKQYRSGKKTGGLITSSPSSDLPRTEDFITMVRKKGKQVQISGSSNGRYGCAS